MKKKIKDIASLGWKKLKNIAIIIKNFLIKKSFYIPLFVIIGGISFISFSIYFIWFVPITLANGDLELINKLRGTNATIIGGLGGFVLLIVQIIRTIKFSKQVKEERRSNISRETLDQYVKAVDQLKDDNMAVRLGGIYSLEKIMNSKDKEVQAYHDTIIELFCAYIREKRHFDLSEYRIILSEIDVYEKLIKRGDKDNDNEYNNLLNKYKKYYKIVETDIQAILTVLGRRENRDNEKVKIDLSNTNLNLCKLNNVDLSNSIIKHAFLVNSDLSDSTLINVNLTASILENVNLSNANLKNSNLTDSNLKNSDLWNTILDRTILEYTDMRGITYSLLYDDDNDKNNINKFINKLKEVEYIYMIKLSKTVMDEIETEYPMLYKRINILDK